MILELPMPPSANRYWRVFRGHTTRSPEARAYIAKVKRLYTPQPFTGPVAVRLDVHLCRGDLDNRIKVVLDALKGLAYVDDKQVRSLRAEKFEASTKTERVLVRVMPWVPVSSLEDEPRLVAPGGASPCICNPNPFQCGVGCRCIGCGCAKLATSKSRVTPNIRRPR